VQVILNYESFISNRIIVPIRHIANTEDQHFKHGASDGTRTPSVSSLRSSTTGRSKTSSHSSHRGISRGAPRAAEFQENAPKIIELDDEPSLMGEGGGMSGTGYMYDQLQKAVSGKDFLLFSI
jgi:hypothetical protein